MSSAGSGVGVHCLLKMSCVMTDYFALALFVFVLRLLVSNFEWMCCIQSGLFELSFFYPDECCNDWYVDTNAEVPVRNFLGDLIIGY